MNLRGSTFGQGPVQIEGHELAVSRLGAGAVDGAVEADAQQPQFPQPQGVQIAAQPAPSELGHCHRQPSASQLGLQALKAVNGQGGSHESQFRTL